MTDHVNRLPRVGALVVIGSLVMALGVPLTAVGKADKVTICHAAGQDGTDQFVTLELSNRAVYGNAGHLNEDGTSRAGHEGDYEGPCVGESTTSTVAETLPTTPDSTTTTPTVVPETSPTSEATTTTTTTVAATPATDPTTTTTVAATPATDPTTTTTVVAEVGATTETTTTTRPEQNQPQAEEEPIITAEAVTPTTTLAPAPSATVEAAAEPAGTLPFTGVEDSLILPAALLLLGGSLLVFATGGSAGAHASTSSLGFGLGLHRGRHESRGN